MRHCEFPNARLEPKVEVFVVERAALASWRRARLAGTPPVVCRSRWRERIRAVADVPCGAFRTLDDTSGPHETLPMSSTAPLKPHGSIPLCRGGSARRPPEHPPTKPPGTPAAGPLRGPTGQRPAPPAASPLRGPGAQRPARQTGPPPVVTVVVARAPFMPPPMPHAAPSGRSTTQAARMRHSQCPQLHHPSNTATLRHPGRTKPAQAPTDETANTPPAGPLRGPGAQRPAREAGPLPVVSVVAA
jgi:hypothetical protein